MAKKQSKNHSLDIKNLIGNDLIFLYLQLIGYPNNIPGKISTNDLLNLRFQNKSLDAGQILITLIALERDGALEMDKVENDNYYVLEISKKTISFIQTALDIYIERFINGGLVPFRDAPYKFKKQKNIFLEKIENEIVDSQSILNFSDADFDEKFNFFECMLALEKQGLIKIKAIYNERRLEEKAFYRVAFEATGKSLKELGLEREKRKLKPECFERGSVGYFQIKSNTKEREIGLKNSRHYLLLKYLVKRGIDEIVDFDLAYNAMEHGKHYKSRRYLNEQDRVIDNAITVLQQKGRIKPFQIKSDQGNKKVWIE